MILAQHYTVLPGNTLSEIASQFGTTWQALWRLNDPPVTNPNLIFAGEQLTVSGQAQSEDPDGDSDDPQQPVGPSQGSQPTPTVSSPSQVYQPPATGSQPVSAPGGVNIPGMPQSLASCIWMRESTDGTNPAANGNQFGIIPASGYNVAGESVAQQEQTAGRIYASVGGAAWAADGCPGT